MKPKSKKHIIKNMVIPSHSEDMQSPKNPLLGLEVSFDNFTQTNIKNNEHEDSSQIFGKSNYKDFFCDTFEAKSQSSQAIMNKFLFQKPAWPKIEPEESDILSKYSKIQEAIKEYFNDNRGYSLYQPDHIVELRKKHSGLIFSILISNDGKNVITGSEDLSVRIWDIKSMKCVGVLRGHTAIIQALALQKNTSKLFSGGQDSAIRVWDLTTNKQIGFLRGHTQVVVRMIITLDSTRLISSGSDKKNIIWDINSYQIIHTIEYQAKYIRSMVVTETRMITVGMETLIRFYDLNTYQFCEKLEGHTAEVASLDINSDYTILVTGSNDNSVIIWDLKKMEQIKKLEQPKNVFSVIFSADYKKIIFQTETGLSTILDAKTYEIIKTFKGNYSMGRRNVLAVHPEINSFFTLDQCISDKAIIEVDLESYEAKRFNEEEMYDEKTINAREIIGVFTIPKNSDNLVIFSIENIIYVWDFITNQLEAKIEDHTGPINSLMVTDFQSLISGDNNERIKIWKLNNYSLELEPDIKKYTYDQAIGVSKSIQFFYFATKDFKICKWDLFENKLAGNLFEGHNRKIKCLCELTINSESMLASGGMELLIIIWNTKTQEKWGVLEGFDQAIDSLIYSDLNRSFLSKSANKIILWDLPNKKQIKSLIGLNGEQTYNAEIYLKPREEFTEIRDVQKDEIIGKINIKQKYIRQMRVDTQSKKIYGYLSNETICVWELNKAEPFISMIPGNASDIYHLQMIEDSKMISTSITGNLTQMWDINLNKMIRMVQISNSYGTVLKVSNDFCRFLMKSKTSEPSFSLYQIKFNSTKQLFSFDVIKHVCYDATPGITKIGFACADNSVLIHDGLNGQLIIRKEGAHAAKILSILISLDENLLLSGGEDMIIKIWTADQLELLGVLEGHTEAIHLLSFVGISDFLISASLNKTIGIWNLSEKKRVGEILTGHSGKIIAIQGNSDSKEIVSVGEDKSVKYWSLEGGMEKESFIIDLKETNKVVISPNLQYLAFNDNNRGIYRWERKTKEINSKFDVPSDYEVRLCFINPNGSNIINTTGNKIMIWDVKSKAVIFNKEIGSFSSYFISPDRMKFCCGRNDGTIDVWDLKEGKISMTLPNMKDTSNIKISSIELISEYNILISGNENGSLYQWDLKNIKECVKNYKMTEAQAFLGSSMHIPKTQKVILLLNYRSVYGDDDAKRKTIKIWDFSLNKLIDFFKYKEEYFSFIFVQHLKKLVVGCRLGALLIWNIGHYAFPYSEKSFVEFFGHTKEITSLREVVPRSDKADYQANKVISLSEDKSIRVWDIKLEICCFVICLEKMIVQFEVLSSNKSYSVFMENMILDIENECIKFKMGINAENKYYVFEEKERNIIYYNSKERKMFQSNIFNYSNMFFCFGALKQNKNDLKLLIKENSKLYPFNFNILHIFAIIDDLNEIDMKNFDWMKFKKLNVPINAFLSLDFQGFTCLDIALVKQNKSVLKNFFELIFNSLEKSEDLYQRLKLFTYDFNYRKGNFIDFMNKLVETYGEDTDILDQIFNFMLSSLSSDYFSPIFREELQKAIFVSTKNLGWLKKREDILELIKDKIKQKQSFFHFLSAKVSASKTEEVLCSIFLIKDITDISPATIQLWETILQLSPTNQIFNNRNLYRLIRYKWSNYGRNFFLKEMAVYLFFFFLYLINFIYFFQDHSASTGDTNSEEIVSVIFDCLDLVYFTSYAGFEYNQMKIQGLRYFLSFWNMVDVILVLGTISTVILDIISIIVVEFNMSPVKIMISITFLSLWIRLFSFARGFEGTGFLIRLVQQVVIDMKFFLFLIFLFMLAFASSGIILQNTYINGPFFVFNLVYRLTLGDYTNYDLFVQDDENQIPLWIGMVLFTLCLWIIMLNLLISIIGSTFAKVVEAENSNRTYELLTVLYEIEKYQILDTKNAKILREEGIIGEYLTVFHNLSHFYDKTPEQINVKKEVLIIQEKIEKIEKHFYEKIDTNKKFLEEKIEKNQEKNEKSYKLMEEKIQKYQEKNENSHKILEEKIENRIKVLLEIKGRLEKK